MSTIPSDITTDGPSLSDVDWNSSENYWININNPRTDKWRALRRKWKIEGIKAPLTASNFGVAADHSPLKKPDVLAYELLTGKKEVPSDERQVLIDKGIEYEHVARGLYSTRFQKTVIEYGLIIPKWDPRIGCVTDGFVDSDGLIEIKCSRRIYKNIMSYPPEEGHSYSKRIFKSHYDQMQGEMAITGRSWCDYIVYGYEDMKIYFEKVHFDPVYWEDTLYPALRKFLEETLPQTRNFLEDPTAIVEDRGDLPNGEISGGK